MQRTEFFAGLASRGITCRVDAQPAFSSWADRVVSRAGPLFGTPREQTAIRVELYRPNVGRLRHLTVSLSAWSLDDDEAIRLADQLVSHLHADPHEGCRREES